MYHYVYITTNVSNGKKYIGKHSFKELENRYLGSGFGIKAAIKKHGRESFVKEIVSTHETEDAAYEAEAILIESVDAIRNPLFYNRTKGGRGGVAGRSLTEDHKRKISKSTKGIVRSAETKARMSKAKKGRKHPLKGKKKSPEAYQRLLEGLQKRVDNGTRNHLEETKRKISDKLKGSGNAGFGLKWITNGISNSRIDPKDPIPDGWRWGKRPYGTKKRNL